MNRVDLEMMAAYVMGLGCGWLTAVAMSVAVCLGRAARGSGGRDSGTERGDAT